MASEPSPLSDSVRVDTRSFVVQRRVLKALVLRELLTRYGRNNIGFLWLFVEPVLFTAAIALVWSVMRSFSGSDIPIVAFAISGYLSLLGWRNPASRCIDAAKNNAALLYHRQVTPVDIFAARIILESVATTTGFAILAAGAVMINRAPMPRDILLLLFGWSQTLWFGAALACIIAGLAEKTDIVGKLWSPMTYLLLPVSGLGFVAAALPENVRDIFLWVPMLNNLEIVRDGWFGDTFEPFYSIGYALISNLVLSFIGLALIRQVGLDSRTAA